MATELQSNGREFQRVGATASKAQSPFVLVEFNSRYFICLLRGNSRQQIHKQAHTKSNPKIQTLERGKIHKDIQKWPILNAHNFTKKKK